MYSYALPSADDEYAGEETTANAKDSAVAVENPMPPDVSRPVASSETTRALRLATMLVNLHTFISAIEKTQEILVKVDVAADQWRRCYRLRNNYQYFALPRYGGGGGGGGACSSMTTAGMMQSMAASVWGLVGSESARRAPRAAAAAGEGSAWHKGALGHAVPPDALRACAGGTASSLGTRPKGRGRPAAASSCVCRYWRLLLLGRGGSAAGAAVAATLSNDRDAERCQRSSIPVRLFLDEPSLEFLLYENDDSATPATAGAADGMPPLCFHCQAQLCLTVLWLNLAQLQRLRTLACFFLRLAPLPLTGGPSGADSEGTTDADAQRVALSRWANTNAEEVCVVHLCHVARRFLLLASMLIALAQAIPKPLPHSPQSSAAEASHAVVVSAVRAAMDANNADLLLYGRHGTVYRREESLEAEVRHYYDALLEAGCARDKSGGQGKGTASPQATTFLSSLAVYSAELAGQLLYADAEIVWPALAIYRHHHHLSSDGVSRSEMQKSGALLNPSHYSFSDVLRGIQASLLTVFSTLFLSQSGAARAVVRLTHTMRNIRAFELDTFSFFEPERAGTHGDGDDMDSNISGGGTGSSPRPAPPPPHQGATSPRGSIATMSPRDPRKRNSAVAAPASPTREASSPPHLESLTGAGPAVTAAEPTDSQVDAALGAAYEILGQWQHDATERVLPAAASVATSSNDESGGGVADPATHRYSEREGWRLFAARFGEPASGDAPDDATGDKKKTKKVHAKDAAHTAGGGEDSAITRKDFTDVKREFLFLLELKHTCALLLLFLEIALDREQREELRTIQRRHFSLRKDNAWPAFVGTEAGTVTEAAGTAARDADKEGERTPGKHVGDGPATADALLKVLLRRRVFPHYYSAMRLRVGRLRNRLIPFLEVCTKGGFLQGCVLGADQLSTAGPVTASSGVSAACDFPTIHRAKKLMALYYTIRAEAHRYLVFADSVWAWKRQQEETLRASSQTEGQDGSGGKSGCPGWRANLRQPPPPLLPPLIAVDVSGEELRYRALEQSSGGGGAVAKTVLDYYYAEANRLDDCCRELAGISVTQCGPAKVPVGGDPAADAFDEAAELHMLLGGGADEQGELERYTYSCADGSDAPPPEGVQDRLLAIASGAKQPPTPWRRRTDARLASETAEGAADGLARNQLGVLRLEYQRLLMHCCAGVFTSVIDDSIKVASARDAGAEGDRGSAADVNCPADLFDTKRARFSTRKRGGGVRKASVPRKGSVPLTQARASSSVGNAGRRDSRPSGAAPPKTTAHPSKLVRQRLALTYARTGVAFWARVHHSLESAVVPSAVVAEVEPPTSDREAADSSRTGSVVAAAGVGDGEGVRHRDDSTLDTCGRLRGPDPSSATASDARTSLPASALWEPRTGDGGGPCSLGDTASGAIALLLDETRGQSVLFTELHAAVPLHASPRRAAREELLLPSLQVPPGPEGVAVSAAAALQAEAGVAGSDRSAVTAVPALFSDVMKKRYAADHKSKKRQSLR